MSYRPGGMVALQRRPGNAFFESNPGCGHRPAVWRWEGLYAPTSPGTNGQGRGVKPLPHLRTGRTRLVVRFVTCRRIDRLRAARAALVAAVRAEVFAVKGKGPGFAAGGAGQVAGVGHALAHRHRDRSAVAAS